MSQLAVIPGRDGHGRSDADRVTFRDALKAGAGTEFVLDSIRLNAPIPDYIFSKAALKK